MTDIEIKLKAQVQALELLLSTVIGMQLMAKVKDEAGITHAADRAREMKAAMQGYTETLKALAGMRGIDLDVVEITTTEMRETIGRCFDQAAQSIDQIAQLALQVTKPTSDAPH